MAAQRRRWRKNQRPMRTAVEEDAHVLQRVADAPDEKVAAQGAAEADAPARARFVIQILQALKVELAMIQIHSQLELPAQEPRLNERGNVILPLGSHRHVQAQFLAAAGE